MIERTVKLKLALTRYGRAYMAYKKAAEKAKPCQGESTSPGANAECPHRAKMVIDGLEVCQVHASALLMKAALK